MAEPRSERYRLTKRRGQRLVDDAERHADFRVRGFACRRERRRPGVLVSVDQHEARSREPVASRGQRAEQHGAVAADQQRQPVAGLARSHGPTTGDEETRERGLVEKAECPSHPSPSNENEVACVAHVAGRIELIDETAGSKDVDRASGPTRLGHRGVRHASQFESCHGDILWRVSADAGSTLAAWLGFERYFAARFKNVSRAEGWGYVVWSAMGLVVFVPEVWAAVSGSDFIWPTISTTVGHLEDRWPVVALIPVAMIVMSAFSLYRVGAGSTAMQADYQGLGRTPEGRLAKQDLARPARTRRRAGGRRAAARSASSPTSRS